MNGRGVSVILLIYFIAGFSSGANAFTWSNAAGSEKPPISLSCLLYGDVGCSKTCHLASLLYDADINPKCVDNVHCVCNEVYHMPGGDLTTGDFQTLSFESLWDNYFENTSQANAIRRYVKKNPEMMALVDSLIRDPHVSGEEIKSQLMFTYPDLSGEFQKLISVKRGLKSDLMSGDHLKYEDILDHFNELVAGIQSSDSELQNIKYRRRISKILESINDESELGHLVDLVKLSGDDSLYNYVTTVLRKRGYVLDSDLEEAIPIVGVFSNGPTEEVLTTNVIRGHNLDVNDIGENDMIELSVITNMAKPTNKNTVSVQITQNDYQQQSVAQMPSVTYTEIAQAPATNVAYIDMTQVPATNVAYTELTQAPAASVAYTEITQAPATNVAYTDMTQAPATNVAYTEITQTPATSVTIVDGTSPPASVNDVLALSNVLAQMQTDIAQLGQEVSQLKSSSSYASVAGNSAIQSPSQLLFTDADLSSMLEMVNVNLANQEVGNFEDSVSAIMNALLTANTVSGSGMPDTAQMDFVNGIPNYMTQVINAPVSYPAGVTVAQMPMVTTITPEAIENSVQYTISKRVKMMEDNNYEGPTGVTIYDTADEAMNVDAPATVTISTSEVSAPAPSADSGTQILITTGETNVSAPSPDVGTQILITTGDTTASAPSPDVGTQILITTNETSTTQNQPINITGDTIVADGNFVNVGSDTQSPSAAQFDGGDQVLVAIDTIPSDTTIQTSVPTAFKKRTKAVSNTANVPKTDNTQTTIAITETAVNNAPSPKSRVAVTDTAAQDGNAKSVSKTRIAVTDAAPSPGPRTRVAVTETATQDGNSRTKIAASETATNSAPSPRTRVAVSETTAQDGNANNVSKSKVTVSETAANSAPRTRTRVAVTETAAQDGNANDATKSRVAVTEANAIKPTKVTRKSTATARTSQSAPAQTTEAAGVTQTTSSSTTTADSAVSVDTNQEEIALDEVPAVIESVANVKKRRVQPKAKTAEQQFDSPTALRSVSASSLLSTLQQAEEDAAADNFSEVTQTETSSSSTTTSSTTTTQESATTNNVQYASANENVAENALASMQAQEPPAFFSSRFGDHVRKFANNFKKS